MQIYMIYIFTNDIYDTFSRLLNFRYASRKKKSSKKIRFSSIVFRKKRIVITIRFNHNLFLKISQKFSKRYIGFRSIFKRNVGVDFYVPQKDEIVGNYNPSLDYRILGHFITTGAMCCERAL